MDRNQRTEDFDQNQRPKDLPHDVVSLEILTRLPVKTLCRFRSVCKHWCLLQNDGKFVRTHLFRASQASNVIAMLFRNEKDHLSTRVSFYSVGISETGNETKLMFTIPIDFDFYSMEASLDGLVCLKTRLVNRKIYICNPSTHEIVQLPQVDPRLGFAGFGFDRCTGAYKVLCAIVDVDHGRVAWYKYTLGSGEDRWRSVCWIPFTDQIKPAENAYIYGCVFWITEDPNRRDQDSNRPDPYAIIFFSFSDEKFRRLPTPNCPTWLSYLEKPELHGRMHLKVIGGYLRLIGTMGGAPGSDIMVIFLWTLKDYKSLRWTCDKIFDIDLLGQNTVFYMPAAVPVDIRNDKMFLTSLNKLYSYDMKSGVLEEINDGIPAEPFLTKDYLANHSESLVPVNRILQ